MTAHSPRDREMQEALRTSRQRLSLVVDAANIGTWDWDITTGELVWSPRCRALFGLPADTPMSYERFLEAVHPDDRQRIDRAIHTAIRNHDDYSVEKRTVWPDGSVHWIAGRGRAYYDASGQPVRMTGASLDITERKRAEEEIRQSERRYRLLAESVPQLVWRASPDGLEVDCNQRWYEYTGQTPAQVQAHGWLAAVHPDDLFQVVERASHAAVTQEPYEIEYHLRRASDGSYRRHLARAVPVRDDDGQVTCWIGCATDVEDLEKAQAEKALREAEKQLQKHHAELAHAARLSIMGEMAASLAHELNQPLQAVKNYARGAVRRLMKRAEQQDPELLAALEQISEEASRAAEIIRRIRGFVQKREPAFCEVSLNDLIGDVILLTKSECEQRRVEVVVELAEHLPPVVGDPIQIEQVVVNLVRNGLEAMDDSPQSRRRLEIRTMQQGAESLQVDVRDCGTGIRAADTESIFEPFFTTKPEGMGMGLSISRSIIQAHGGRLWVSANPDCGSTFHFTLPLDRD